MDGQVEEDLRTAVDIRKKISFQRLRLGLKLSIATIILFDVASITYYAFIYLLYPIGILFVLSIHERTSGWRLLGSQDTSIVMWLCAILLHVSPLGLAFFGVVYGIALAFLIPLGLWGLYTYVENNSIKKLDEKFALNLRPARLSALAGVIVSGIAYTYGLYAQIASFFPYPANAFRLSVFGTPFLILSCLLLIRGLRLASELHALGKFESGSPVGPESRFCIKCGTEITPNAKYCPRCGQRQFSSGVD
jgi:hypothetical protein